AAVASEARAALARALFQTQWSLMLASHTGAVRQVGFSPDGSRVVTASDDATARIWDATTGKELITLRGHTGAVAAAAFSPDNSRVVTASNDKTARIWDATTGKELMVLRGHTESVLCASFSSDGFRIVTGSDDMTARTWDASSGRELLSLRGLKEADHPTVRFRMRELGLKPVGHQGSVSFAAFSPDGSRILGLSGGTALIWDATTGDELLVYGDYVRARSAAFSPDGSLIVTASRDKSARIWDAATGKELLVLSGHNDQLSSAAFSPDGR